MTPIELKNEIHDFMISIDRLVNHKTKKKKRKGTILAMKGEKKNLLSKILDL